MLGLSVPDDFEGQVSGSAMVENTVSLFQLTASTLKSVTEIKK